MELTFEFADNAKWKTGEFVFDDIQVIGEGDDVNIQYDNIELYLDGNLYDGGISTFHSNSLSTDELFESVLNSYLCNNTGEYKSFGSGWSVFSKIMDKTEEGENGLPIKIPVYDGFDIVMYELQLATPERRYYVYDDDYMVLDNNGEVVTDYEFFYTQAFEADLYECLKSNTECLYRGYDVDAVIEEYDGEEGFIEYYQGEHGE